VRHRDRLTFKFSRLGEGEAAGRYAIAALVVTVTIRSMALAAAAGAVSYTLRVFLPFCVRHHSQNHPERVLQSPQRCD
jgi:hypothetical protein